MKLEKVKGKVPIHDTKAYRRCGDAAAHILKFGSGWRWVVGLKPCLLYFRERTTSTRWIGGWVVLGVSKDVSLAPPGIRIPDRLARSQVSIMTTQSRLPVINSKASESSSYFWAVRYCYPEKRPASGFSVSARPWFCFSEPHPCPMGVLSRCSVDFCC